MSKSSRTTGNEPIAAIDPGGTKPASGGHGKGEQKTEQKVQSGDRNTVNDGKGTALDAEARNKSENKL